ncbi:MAG: ArsR family transcriptional regulator [Frankiales bacterium]|nr:ArsR family transcriptional regulator [Frankiales bacterium]
MDVKFDEHLITAQNERVPKTLPLLDVTAPVCCSPLAAGAMDEQAALEVALRLKALADPARVRLMSLVLAAEDAGCCTCDLAPLVGLTEATVSHHLKQLREAGLVEGTREGMNVFYRPLRDNLTALCRVIDPACC